MPDDSRRPPGSGDSPARPQRPGDRSRPHAKPKHRGGPGNAPGSGPRRSGPKPTGPAKTGIRLRPLGGNAFELDHPPCVRETELDYEEGLEIWKHGDPDAARDALRFALSACRDNLWVHEALGRIALREFNDAQLAIGHFGYVIELTTLVLTDRFSGILPSDRRNNRPVYDALDGLIACHEQLANPREAAGYRKIRDAWSKGRGFEGRRGSKN